MEGKWGITAKENVLEFESGDGCTICEYTKKHGTIHLKHTQLCLDFPGGSDGKASAYSAGDPGSIPGLGRSSGDGNGTRLQYSCHGRRSVVGYSPWVAKSRTGLSDFTFTFQRLEFSQV